MALYSACRNKNKENNPLHLNMHSQIFIVRSATVVSTASHGGLSAAVAVRKIQHCQHQHSRSAAKENSKDSRHVVAVVVIRS